MEETMKTRAAMERDGEVPTKMRAAWCTPGDAKTQIVNMMAEHHKRTGKRPTKIFLTPELEHDLARLPLEALGNNGIELFMSVGVRGAVMEWGSLFGMDVAFDATEDRVE